MSTLHCGSWGRVTTPSLAARPGNPDFGLVRLCARMLTAHREEQRVSAIYARLRPTEPRYAEFEARQRIADVRIDDLAWRIGCVKARTAAGRRAKAAALQAIAPPDNGWGYISAGWHADLMPSLLADLAGGSVA